MHLKNFPILLGVLLVLLATTSSAAVTGPSPRTQSPLTEVALNPGLIAYAAQHAIPLEGIEFSADIDRSHKGDETVFVFSLQQDKGFKQWLVRMVADDLNSQKGESKSLKESTMFTSTGQELHYIHSPTALAVEFIGPFDPGTDSDANFSIKRARTLVSAESLRQGMDQYCHSGLEIAARLKTAGITVPIYYGGYNRPSTGAIAAGRAAAAAFQLTPEEERLAFSVYFSLQAFYSAATEISACRDVMEQVLQKPSLWSLLGNLGVNTNFDYGWQEVETAVGNKFPTQAPVYLLPVRLSLNNRPAVKVTLAVSSTRPPLRNCAGIVALCAEHPTDETKRIFIRLVSAHAAKTAAPGKR